MAFSLPRHVSLPTLLALPVAVLLVAYTYALSRRPAYPDQYTVNDPWTYGFPSWFSDKSSPYDASPSQEASLSSLDVLLWIDLPFDSPYNLHALAALKALEASPSITVRTVTSLNPTWVQEDDASTNLEAAGCGDWVWRVAETSTTSHACPGAIWISEILQQGEAGVSGSTTKDLLDARANITLQSRPQQLFEPESSYERLKSSMPEQWEMGYMSHILPFADFSTYYPSSRRRRRSITYFPSSTTGKDNYPTLPWGSGWSMYKASATKPPAQAGQDPWCMTSSFRLYWAKEEKRKARAMRDTDICLFEGWENGLLTADMAQAMLSGCIVAMTEPQIQHDVLRPLVLLLPKTAYELGKLPVDAISAALTSLSDSDLANRSMKSFIVARQMFTPTNRINNVLETVQTWKEGARGYNLPNAFRWNCDSEPRPPWCST